jgi:hypothetical protein
MGRLLAITAVLLTLSLGVLSGCGVLSKTKDAVEPASTTPEPAAPVLPATALESPNLAKEYSPDTDDTPAPLTIDADHPPQYWDMKLEEAIRVALENSKVMRDLGGQVIRSPGTTRTVLDPAIVETDPRYGVDAALSAFDATFASTAYFEKNDRALNNSFFGGGTRLLQQDLNVYQTQITKRSATGSEFTIRNNTEYNANNAPANIFGSAWDFNMEALVRQPFLQGAGSNFNRIAGPGSVAGVANGVLVSRINTDVSLADFEVGVQNLLSDVENAYWDLYFGFRDLDAKIAARDAALETWRRIQAANAAGRRGAEAAKEAQAREQYFRFQEEVENALSGKLLEGTRTNNGSSGGTFRSGAGVLVTERRLRLLMGITINDGRLIRPADEPQPTKFLFNWDLVRNESLDRRAELRRQRWLIKRRELELEAAENFLMPRLDGVGRYRWRGFGKDLLSRDDQEFSNAIRNMTGGDFQEWQLGVEFTAAIGNRKGHAAVKNAELILARERTVLHEQEREVVLAVSNSVSEIERARRVTETNFNRRLAAKEQLAALRAAEEADIEPDLATLDLILEAQRRLAEADSRYFNALVEYAVAVKNLHYEKGTLLDYNGVWLSEGPWDEKAHIDAEMRESLRSEPWSEKLVPDSPPPVSAGYTPQGVKYPRPESMSRPQPKKALREPTPMPEVQ